MNVVSVSRDLQSRKDDRAWSRSFLSSPSSPTVTGHEIYPMNVSCWPDSSDNFFGALQEEPPPRRLNVGQMCPVCSILPWRSWGAPVLMPVSRKATRTYFEHHALFSTPTGKSGFAGKKACRKACSSSEKLRWKDLFSGKWQRKSNNRPWAVATCCYGAKRWPVRHVRWTMMNLMHR